MSFLDKFRLLLLTFPLDADRYGGNLYSIISYLLQELPVYNCSPSLPESRARLFVRISGEQDTQGSRVVYSLFEGPIALIEKSSVIRIPGTAFFPEYPGDR